MRCLRLATVLLLSAAITPIAPGESIVDSRSALALDINRSAVTHSASADRSSPWESNTAKSIDSEGPNPWVTGLIILALVGHQLRRKHRLLKPQKFLF